MAAKSSRQAKWFFECSDAEDSGAESGASGSSGMEPQVDNAKRLGKFRECCWRWRRTLCCLGCCGFLALSGLIAGLIAAKVVSNMRPTWEVLSVAIEGVDIPALTVAGLVSADTSKCPPTDPCGVATSRGCSVCPSAGMWNDGCLCRKGTAGGAPPGTIIPSDHAKCPPADPCGVASSRGCSTCPDSTWINDGCTCRQPLSASDFFSALTGMIGLITGTTGTKTLVKMQLHVIVEVWNPAAMSANTEEGLFSVTHQGTPIGTARLLPATVPASSSVNLAVDVTVDNVSQEVAARLLQDILSSSSLLSLDVEGHVVARAAGFAVTCTASCHLGVDVSKMPKTDIKRKDCSYKYAL